MKSFIFLAIKLIAALTISAQENEHERLPFPKGMWEINFMGNLGSLNSKNKHSEQNLSDEIKSWDYTYKSEDKLSFFGILMGLSIFL
ncbi:MAG: hypothetical protein KJ799_09175 [Bacteroidetes bacterium]|nr:hypothetical protein [Bacteroidota bacterium]